jgi:hypothetical protein
MRQQANKGPRQQTAAISEEGEDNCKGIRGCAGQRSHLESGGTFKKALYEICRRKKVKQIAGSYVTTRKIKNWTLWRGQPPLKQLKNLSHV